MIGSAEFITLMLGHGGRVEIGVSEMRLWLVWPDPAGRGKCCISARELLLAVCGDACAYCRPGLPALQRLTLDHVVPLRHGGRHSVHNLVLACNNCNHHKHDRMPNERELAAHASVLAKLAAVMHRDSGEPAIADAWRAQRGPAPLEETSHG